MRGSLGFALCLVSADAGWSRCPTPDDLDRGIVIVFDNRVGTYTVQGEGMVLSSSRYDADGSLSDTVLYRGVVPLRAIRRDQPGGELIEDFSYGMETGPLEALWPLEIGDSYQVRNRHEDQLTGASQLVEFSMLVAEETEIAIGDCRYDGQVVQMEFTGSGGGYRAEVAHLTALGLSFVMADVETGRDTDRFTALSIAPLGEE